MILKPATNDQAFLKMGIMGFSASGKTYTASKVAIGLHAYIKSNKPIAFIDTETGSDYVLELFQKEGIELLTAKSRLFIDLLSVGKEAQNNCDILIIDSISHFWTELTTAYKKKMNRTRLRIQDWDPLKTEWREFTDWYVNSPLHVIMAGRAGWEYDFREDEDGITEIAKTGTKMKAETEMGYEPSLLVEMEKVRSPEAIGKIGQGFINRAWICKDRFAQINGKCFDFPTFESFLPHIQKLNIGGVHIGVGTEGSSADLFDMPNSGIQWQKRREIALENIENEIVMVIPGRSAKDQQAKIKILEGTFGTASWKAVEGQSPDALEIGLEKIKKNYPREVVS